MQASPQQNGYLHTVLLSQLRELLLMLICSKIR